jgi:hypothetical protein
MDKSKAKKAVKKSESRKQMAEAANMMANMQAAAGAGIDPEVQSPQIDMQPPTINPYHAMGSMAPMTYAPGNMLPGYNFPVMVNPEA